MQSRTLSSVILAVEHGNTKVDSVEKEDRKKYHGKAGKITERQFFFKATIPVDHGR
jgi:hypothetical protein